MLDGDLRRFSVQPTAKIEDLRTTLKAMYRLETPDSVTIKYVDDEGDLISITSTEELVEAFRLSKDLQPPILRLTLYHTASPVPLTTTTTTTEEPAQESNEYPPLPVSEWDAPKKQPVPQQTRPEEITKVEIVEIVQITKEESNEYPPLPVSEWDAPEKKKPVLLVNVKIPQHGVEREITIPISISAQMKEHCVATTEDVHKYSTETMKAALPFAQVYSQLSNDIAKQCTDLSNSTAELSKRLSSLQAEETIKSSVLGQKDVSDLSLATMRECQKLSEATAAICRNLSAATIDNCKNLSANSNARLVDTTGNRSSELSDDIKSKCGQLSSETKARSAQISADIRKLIMEI